MTPKEKAQELVSKYVALSILITPKSARVDWCIKCALIAINEKINLYNELNSLGLLKENSVGFELIEVKQEIEKL